MGVLYAAADEEFDHLCFEYGIELDDVVSGFCWRGAGEQYSRVRQSGRRERVRRVRGENEAGEGRGDSKKVSMCA
jgi:hypothetical protein